MQKKAELAELNKAAVAPVKSEKPASSEAAASERGTAAEAKPDEDAEKPTAAAAAAATAAGTNDEEQSAEADHVDEKQDLEDEIKELNGVHEELLERSSDLVSQRQQVRAQPQHFS